MSIATSGISDAAKILEQTQRSIEKRCDLAVTLSRHGALDAILEAWQCTEEGWKIPDDETAITL